MTRYAFFNFSDAPFDGRFGGAPYHFAAQETREFDPDKHYMLIVLAKQLADRELMKNIKGIGRDPKNEDTWGKALDSNGNLWVVTKETRKEMMRKAIGALVDTPVPTPEQPGEEAGATKGTQEDIAGMQEQIRHLTELVESLAASKAPPVPAAVPTPQPPQSPTADPQPPVDATPNMGMTRDILYEMAVEQGLPVHEGLTKEELIEMLNKPRPAA